VDHANQTAPEEKMGGPGLRKMKENSEKKLQANEKKTNNQGPTK